MFALQQKRQPIDVEATQLEPVMHKGETQFHWFEQQQRGASKAGLTHAAPRKWVEGQVCSGAVSYHGSTSAQLFCYARLAVAALPLRLRCFSVDLF